MSIEHKDINNANRHSLKDFETAATDTVASKDSAGNLEWVDKALLGGTGPTGPAGTTLVNVSVADIENPTELNTTPATPTNGDTVTVKQVRAGTNYVALYQYDSASTASQASPFSVNGDGGGLWILKGTNKPYQMIGDATIQSPRDVHTSILSAGVVSGGILSPNGVTLDVAAGYGFIRSTDSNTGELFSVDWAQVTGIPLTLNILFFIYLEWNSGTPQIVAATTERTDLHTNIFLGTALYDGSLVHLGTESRFFIGDHLTHIIERFQQTEPYEHVSGASLSEVGTRNIAVTAGDFWQSLVNFQTTAKDTSAADTFTYFYRDGSTGWTSQLAQTQYNNTQWDNNTGALATLGNGKYGVHWVYLMTSVHASIVFGRGDYTLTEAQDAGVPSDLPLQISAHGFLIGKIIVQKSAASATSVESAFITQFQTSQPTEHNSLVGLQGGQASEYFHLTSAEHTNVAYKNSNQTFQNNVQVQGQAYVDTNTLADAATINTDCDTGNVHTVTLEGNRTLANPTNLKDGGTYIFIIKQDGVGTRTLAYGSAFKFEDSVAPILSTALNSVDLLTCVSDGTNLYGQLTKAFG